MQDHLQGSAHQAHFDLGLRCLRELHGLRGAGDANMCAALAAADKCFWPTIQREHTWHSISWVSLLLFTIPLYMRVCS